MELFRLILTVVVLGAIAVAILLFEKKRAARIERDLRQARRDTRRPGGSADGRP